MEKPEEVLPETDFEATPLFILKQNTESILPEMVFLQPYFSQYSSVSKLDTYKFSKWNPAVGTGIRIKWNKQNDSNLILDLA